MRLITATLAATAAKYSLFFLVLAFTSLPAVAQDITIDPDRIRPEVEGILKAGGYEEGPGGARAADGASIDAILTALYESISGPAGQPRDWDRLRSLLIPGARLIPTGRRPDGPGTHAVWTVDEYIERNEALMVKIGFRETEIGRVTERFGNIAHAYSAYEAFEQDREEPLMRGINSIKLWNDGSRWWIVSLMWQQESPEHPIPERYLVSPA